MSLFSASFVAHLIAAIFGVGPIVVMAIVGSRAPATGELALERRELLARLSRWVSLALALMLVTGVAMEIGVGGVFHRTWWYRASVLLLLLAGALVGVAGRRLRTTEPADVPARIRFAARASRLACALIVAITLLMTLRPG
jgi:hypothetical protein